MILRHRGWTDVALGSVAQIDRVAVAPQKISAGSYYVGLEHIGSSGDITSPGVVNPGDLASTKFAFTDRHVLYGKLRPYLQKIARPAFSGICSTDILPILPGPEVDRDFLFYFLRHPTTVSLATARSEGVNLPRVSPKVLMQFQMPFPRLTEQRRIAAILDKADAVRRKRRENFRLLDEFLKSAFLERFGDPIRNERGWDFVTLGDCFETKPTIGTVTPAIEGGQIKVVRVGELGQFEVTLDRCGFVTLSKDDVTRFEAREGDLLLARAIGSESHLGKASVLAAGFSELVVFDSHVMRLRFKPDRIRAPYFWQWLQSPGGRRLLLREGGRTAVQFNINASQVCDVKLPLPPVERQEQFMTLARRARAMQVQQATAGREADALFDSLSRRAFQERG